jgi:hypothetical protein
VVYDQDITIPITDPRISRREEVMNYLGQTLKQTGTFEFQNGYLSCAKKQPANDGLTEALSSIEVRAVAQ